MVKWWTYSLTLTQLPDSILNDYCLFPNCMLIIARSPLVCSQFHPLVSLSPSPHLPISTAPGVTTCSPLSPSPLSLLPLTETKREIEYTRHLSDEPLATREIESNRRMG